MAIDVARNYEDVLKGKYPAKTHARKVKDWILEKGGDAKGTVYLESQKQKLLEVGWILGDFLCVVGRGKDLRIVLI